MSEYEYQNSDSCHTSAYLWNPVIELLQKHLAPGEKVFDLGCGNGAFARHLKRIGYQLNGVDTSESGITVARDTDPELRLEIGSAYDDLVAKFGTFPAVVSLEVIEHLYYPRKFAACVYNLLSPNGIAIISTPYHGYIKNLALALTGKLDDHFNALWDHGHIKFWSIKTLTQLFKEQNMQCIKVLRVGRLPLIAKSMILVFRKY